MSTKTPSTKKTADTNTEAPVLSPVFTVLASLALAGPGFEKEDLSPRLQELARDVAPMLTPAGLLADGSDVGLLSLAIDDGDHQDMGSVHQGLAVGLVAGYLLAQMVGGAK